MKKILIALIFLFATTSFSAWVDGGVVQSVFCPTDGTIQFNCANYPTEMVVVLGNTQAQKNTLALLLSALTAGKRVGFERTNYRTGSPWNFSDCSGITIMN